MSSKRVNIFDLICNVSGDASERRSRKDWSLWFCGVFTAYAVRRVTSAVRRVRVLAQRFGSSYESLENSHEPAEMNHILDLDSLSLADYK